MKNKRLKKLFNPESVALIGATDKEGSIGNILLDNLLGNEYKGKIFPVNPNRESVKGMKCYKEIGEIEGSVDLAIIATPAITVPQIVKGLGVKNVLGAVIMSSGFKEIGSQGDKLFEEIKTYSQKYGINILGPNCMGFIRPAISLNATFTSQMPKPGKIAFISQSGALCSAILEWSIKENVGFSYFVSIGEMLDIGFAEAIDFFGEQDEVSSILLYMESLNNAKKFMSAARAYARVKPIVVLKSGKSLEGAKAALSHTGGLAGNDNVYDAVFKRTGILRVDTISELFDCAEALDMQKPPLGNKLTILTNAGGPGVIATDCLISKGGQLTNIDEEIKNNLKIILPPNSSVENPIDILGDASPQRFEQALKILIEDSKGDGNLVVLTPQAMTNVTEISGKLSSISKNSTKTILASYMGSKSIVEGKKILEEGKVPVYKTPEQAVTTFINMYNYHKNLDLLYQTPATIPHAFKPETGKNKDIIKKAYFENRFILTEDEAKEILRNYSLPTPLGYLARNENEIDSIVNKLKFPLIAKIVSPQILHKTDVKGTVANIKSVDEAKEQYFRIIEKVKETQPDAKIYGVLYEEMHFKKYELFIGAKRDPIFGPIIVFGMGGIAVEVFNDINIAIPPLNMTLAQRLIEDTKIYKLLQGIRGQKSIDISSIQFALYKFAYLIMDFPEILEIDINPFAVDDNGSIVLDAKIILDKNLDIKNIKPYSHLVISPYPKDYEVEFKMKDGQTVILRPIRPEDEPMEAEMFTKFSKETQRYRFFSLLKDVTHQMLVRFTQIDYDREIAIIAELNDEGKKKMLGVVRLIADGENEKAEVALVIADPWQGLGLGKRMFSYILEIAKKKAVKKVHAYFLDDNVKMMSLLKSHGFIISSQNGNLFAQLDMASYKG